MLRELQEELGLRPEDIEDLRLRYITLRSIKGEIRQNYYFFAELKEQAGEDQVSNEGTAKGFRWMRSACWKCLLRQSMLWSIFVKQGVIRIRCTQA